MSIYHQAYIVLIYAKPYRIRTPAEFAPVPSTSHGSAHCGERTSSALHFPSSKLANPVQIRSPVNQPRIRLHDCSLLLVSPEGGALEQRTKLRPPPGLVELRLQQRFLASLRGAGGFGALSGGVAALNPRLISYNPSGEWPLNKA